MGGKSSSSSSQASYAYDNRIGVSSEGSVLIAAGGSTVNMTDPGLIDLTSEALSSNENIVLKVLEAAGNLSIESLKSIGANADKAFEFVDKQNQDEQERTVRTLVPWLMSGVAVFAIAWAIKK